MGNVDSRCKYDHGYMMVQTFQPYYMPGQQITGNIYLRLTHPLDVVNVVLEVKGQEKASFVEVIQRNYEGRIEHEHVKRKSKREIMHFKAPCFQFQVPTLFPGDYVIPFAFNLPQGIPSSIYFKNPHIEQKPKGKVKYHIKALLMGHHHKELMKYKQVIVLREMGEAFQEKISQVSENRITTWCCVAQGTSKIEVTFDKNVFEPLEICKAHVDLNNSNCNVALTDVRLALEQEVSINADGHNWRTTNVLANRSEAGCGPRHPDVEHRTLDLDLKTIRFDVPNQRKKKGQMKPLSQEDMFMMQNMQPACHASHIKNDYFLAVRCTYAGCLCCSAQPHARIPLTIVPIANPQCYGFQQPADFQPQTYAQFSFQLQQ